MRQVCGIGASLLSIASVRFASFVGFVSFVGCFDPVLTEEIACSLEVGCPNDLVCLSNLCVESGAQVFEDVVLRDATSEEFNRGEHMGTEAGPQGLTLVSGMSDGVFVSRIFDAQAQTEWESLQWLPVGPYGAQLADNNKSESGYTVDNVSMVDNVLLLHCEDSSADTSERETTLVQRLPAEGEQYLDSGVIGKSCRIEPPFDYLIEPEDNGLQFGTSDYTWATWVRTTTSCEGNDVFIGADADVPGDDGTHVWLGCSRGDDGTGAICPSAPGGYLSGRQSSKKQADAIGFCGQTQINDGNWHHIALVKKGHSSVSITTYVDGVVDTESLGSFATDIRLPDGKQFGLGRYPNGGFSPESSTEVDELGIWRRALTAEEISALYRRGAVRASFGVASCADESCSTPFTDEDGELNGSFEDRGTNELPAGIELLVDSSRYFRYRISLQAPPASVTAPIIKQVTVLGESVIAQ